jgi:hypothetical protein
MLTMALNLPSAVKIFPSIMTIMKYKWNENVDNVTKSFFSSKDYPFYYGKRIVVINVFTEVTIRLCTEIRPSVSHIYCSRTVCLSAVRE